jgi:hypothetical protein
MALLSLNIYHALGAFSPLKTASHSTLTPPSRHPLTTLSPPSYPLHHPHPTPGSRPIRRCRVPHVDLLFPTPRSEPVVLRYVWLVVICAHALMHSCTVLAHSCTHALIHSYTRTLVHSYTHTLIHPHTHTHTLLFTHLIGLDDSAADAIHTHLLDLVRTTAADLERCGCVEIRDGDGNAVVSQKGAKSGVDVVYGSTPLGVITSYYYLDYKVSI